MSHLRAALLRLTAATLLSFGPVCAAEASAPAAPPAAAAPTSANPTAAGASAPVSTSAKRDLSRYKEERVPGGTFMLAAYMVMWALVAGFVGRTLLRQAKVEAELTDLSERVDVLTGHDGDAT